jgi:hypothetical protein
MNYNLDDLEKELIICQAEFDLAVNIFIKSLQAYNNRLERVEKCIDQIRKLMLN